MRIIAFFILLAVPLLGQEIRTFTSSDGRTIRASLVNYNPADGKVVIRREDNHTVTVNFDRFSAEDQAYLQKWRNEYDRGFVQFEFMGIRVRSSRIVFVIDKSGSMEGRRWEKLLHNLEDVIDNIEMPSDFNVILFSNGSTSLKPTIQPATKAFKAEAISWLNRQGPEGGTYVSGALENAFQDPDVETIVLLSDGAPSRSPDFIFGMVETMQLNREKPVVIHTVSYQATHGKEFLRELAKRNQGKFAAR
ncbi:MAG: VWA domain-containing protein [Verrucomicrobiota bacterium]